MTRSLVEKLYRHGYREDILVIMPDEIGELWFHGVGDYHVGQILTLESDEGETARGVVIETGDSKVRVHTPTGDKSWLYAWHCDWQEKGFKIISSSCVVLGAVNSTLTITIDGDRPRVSLRLYYEDQLVGTGLNYPSRAGARCEITGSWKRGLYRLEREVYPFSSSAIERRLVNNLTGDFIWHMT